jgi:NAD(P)-dependent dehydrogenase (short-subunit alcohol dehydrogenase family)
VGAATVLGLARRGYDVVINYTKSEAEAAASAAACAEAGADTLVVRADVADDAACRSMVGAAVDRWGRIDALVNNAGRTSVASMAGWEGIRCQPPNLGKMPTSLILVAGTFFPSPPGGFLSQCLGGKLRKVFPRPS